MRGHFSLAIASALLAGACSSSGLTSTPDSGALSDDGGGGSDDGGPPAGPLTITFGPITVPGTTERTQCVEKRLGNPTPIHVGAIHDVLGTSSHHMIVYKVSDTTEKTTPYDCKPFTDTLDPTKGNPLVISQKSDDLLQLPAGVGFALDANQMIRLEMHYINATTGPVTLESSATFVPIDDAQFQNEASFLFIGDPDISIPPQASKTLGPVYFQVPSTYASAKFFAMTGHEHQWGKNVQVWNASSASDPGTPVYQVPGWSWSEPKTVTFDPPMTLPAGGGFRFQCDWYNGSTSTVTFGESATDEMCFFWAYYYPSQGARVCVHTDQAPGGLDACCPGGNSVVCNYLKNH